MPKSAKQHPISGRPSSQTPPLDEPTELAEPLAPKPDQTAPEPYSATGQPTGAPLEARAQGGSYLTTAQGARLPDTDHSL
jgi:catalase